MSFERRFIDKKCEFCGNKFDASIIAIKKGEGKFCSKKCSMNNILKFRKPAKSVSRLNEIAREVYVERHGEPICEICGSTHADIHHQDENIENNSDGNLKALCRSCHTKHHNMSSSKGMSLCVTI